MPGIDALREEIEAERHEAHIAGALAIAEEAAFHAIGARHHAELRGRHAAAAVVVRMKREHDAVAPGEVAMHPLDLVGVDVGGRHLHRGRQIDDRLALRRRLPHVEHGVADVLGEIELGSGEALRRVLERPLGVGLLRGTVTHDLRGVDGDLPDAFAIEAEHHASLRGRGGVVKMHDRALGALQRFERALDERRARLREHLHVHVVGDHVLLDEQAHEIEVGLRGRGKADLDLLVAHLHELPEHAELALGVHGLDQRLVPVAQIHAAPDGRLGDHLRRPGAVGQGDGGERTVLHGRIDLHGRSREWSQACKGERTPQRMGLHHPVLLDGNGCYSN